MEGVSVPSGVPSGLIRGVAGGLLYNLLCIYMITYTGSLSHIGFVYFRPHDGGC